MELLSQRDLASDEVKIRRDLLALAAGQKQRAAQLLSTVNRCPAALTPGELAAARALQAAGN